MSSNPSYIGLVLDGYELQRLIGSGSYGDVYYAVHTVMRQEAAVKVWTDLSKRQQGVANFKKEARIIASLKHHNIVYVYNTGLIQGTIPYITMSYIPRSLEETFPPGHKAPLQEVVKCMTEVGSALQYAHDQIPPVIHRDVKPANILIAGNGEYILSDLGEASLNQGKKPAIQGTFEYMPPEAFIQRDYYPPNDQYALGIVAYRLLTGSEPYQDSGSPNAQQAMADMILMHRNIPLPPINEAIPQGVKEAIYRALAKDRNDRFPSVRDFVQAFVNAANQPTPFIGGGSQTALVLGTGQPSIGPGSTTIATGSTQTSGTGINNPQPVKPVQPLQPGPQNVPPQGPAKQPTVKWFPPQKPVQQPSGHGTNTVSTPVPPQPTPANQVPTWGTGSSQLPPSPVPPFAPGTQIVPTPGPMQPTWNQQPPQYAQPSGAGILSPQPVNPVQSWGGNATQNNAPIHYQRACLLFQNRQFLDALQELEEALRYDPNLSEAYVTQAIVYNQLGQYSEAINAANTAIQINPYHYQTYSCQADAYLRLHRPSEALTAANEAIRINPGYSPPYVYRAEAYRMLGQYADTIAAANVALVINHQDQREYVCLVDERAYECLVIAYIMLGRDSEAMDAANMILTLNSQNYVAYATQAQVYNRLGRYSDAIIAANSAVRIHPGFSKAYRSLAVAYYNLGRYSEALDAADRALSIDPQDRIAQQVRNTVRNRR